MKFTIGYDTDGQSCLDHENEDWWCGECDQCIALMYPDEDFREEWIEKKKDAQPRPPSLQVVEWRFVHLDLQVPSVEAILQELYEDNDVCQLAPLIPVEVDIRPISETLCASISPDT